jgi:hypothetical protein
MVLSREKEESLQVVNEKQSTLRDWARLEITNRIKSGKTPDKATRETLDFALILGKLNGMNTEEKISFFSFCEGIERQITTK